MVAFNASAGGSGLNTVVIANRSSSNSLELANYFCERRAVPPENVLRIAWGGGNTSWTSYDFQTNLLNPLLNMLVDRQLTNQIDYVVLSMDIPFQTVNSNGITINGTTSALFYGLKPVGSSYKGVPSSYFSSEAIFRLAKPSSAPGYSFLTVMITGDSLAHAKQLVDQGVASDGVFPNQPVILAKSSDPARNIRYTAFDNAIFNTRLRHNSTILRTNINWCYTTAMGYETGLANFSVAPSTFVPGAMADSLTSFGGIIFGDSGQTSLLAFINGGASGSYGTVTEPMADPSKFPDPQAYFYQSRGFSLAECYYQSINVPYLGLIVAEPLAAPCRVNALGKWLGTNSHPLLSGNSQLSWSASGAQYPLQQVDLFLDGKYFQTLTNLPPRPGNLFKVMLNGFPITYTVPANSTIASVTSGLAALLNNPATSNATKVKATAHGDRIELQSLSTNRFADSFYFTDSAATNVPSRSYRISYLPVPVPPQLTLLGINRNGNSTLHIDTPTAMPCIILASTDLVGWLPIFTNLFGSSLDFVDPASSNYPVRFYRIVGMFPEQRPRLTALANPNLGFTVHVDATGTVPYALQFCSNFTDWTSISTNLTGGSMDLTYPQPTNSLGLYRALLMPQLPTPAVVVVDPTAPGGALVRVDGAARPYVIEVSTNGSQWSSLLTNLGLGKVQVGVSSSIGSSDMLSTFLTASHDSLLNSDACGLRQFSVGGSPDAASWIQLSVTKTTGMSVSLGVTNYSGGTAAEMARQLCTLINSNSLLRGLDGVVAEDLMTNMPGTASFNLRARFSGYDAAAVTGLLSGSGDLSTSPSAQAALTQNISDLQPPGHLYVSAGMAQLPITFSLDTTAIADGSHELTAVAYEGTHVQTQSPFTLPVTIRNSSLTATLTPLDFADSAPVQGTYHIQVAANAGNISTISLFSTGGLWNSVTNQSTATFSVDGPTLGVGLHPFYAVVKTATGLKYRTDVRSLRLVSGP